jgi:aldehyde dehydrogenase (NAD+)
MQVLRSYIDGAWLDPADEQTIELVDPATEKAIAAVPRGSAVEVDRAVAAARKAFPAFSATTPEARIALLKAVQAIYARREEDLAQAVCSEIGAPYPLSRYGHVAAGPAHLGLMIAALESYPFEAPLGAASIRKEPIGVCGLITPWNWPINQVCAKVVPALAAGCTVILKPSELSPLSAQILAEILDEAGLPAGVFNLVHGMGETVGAAISSHPDIDMVSFTGSTRAGILVAQAAAATVKRVTQELGGKSANIILDDADFETAVAGGIGAMMVNSGQSCNAPSRMLIPASRRAELAAAVDRAVAGVVPGAPHDAGATIGPVAGVAQWNKIQRLIETGIGEGATLLAGGPGRPAGLEAGFFVRPTIFADVTNDMTIAREEIFGPVLSILTYETEDEAVTIANDTPYGLAGYVQSGDPARARRVANRIRAGNIYLNGAHADIAVPFGGFKQSGNGREWGLAGLEEYLETKAILGV